MQYNLFNAVSDKVTSNDYYTPAWLFEGMAIKFDIDVAAPLLAVPWIPAKRWFSQADDGLTQDWGGGMVWMNPPFSNITPWVTKFIENGNGVALLVVSRSKWFSALWDKADLILPTPADLKFHRPDGRQQAISFQTFLFAIGKQGCQGLRNLQLGRVR